MVLIGAILALTISLALFVVSLKRRNASLVSAGKWSAFTASKYRIVHMYLYVPYNQGLISS